MTACCKNNIAIYLDFCGIHKMMIHKIKRENDHRFILDPRSQFLKWFSASTTGEAIFSTLKLKHDRKHTKQVQI